MPEKEQKDKQWSTKHYTEHERSSNTKTTKNRGRKQIKIEQHESHLNQFYWLKKAVTNLDPPFPEDMIIYHLSMGGNRTDSIGNRISDDQTITATDCPLDQKRYM